MTHHGISIIFTYVSSPCANLSHGSQKLTRCFQKIRSTMLEEVKVHYEEYLTQKQSFIFFCLTQCVNVQYNVFTRILFYISDNSISIRITSYPFVRTCWSRVNKKRNKGKKERTLLKS